MKRNSTPRCSIERTHLSNHRDVARAYFRLIDGKEKKREKGEIKTKNRKKGGRNAVKRVARRVEQCVINVKREPRANRFERVSLLRTRSPRPLAIFLLFRIQAESKVVLRPPFFDARILKPETPF